MKSESFQRGFLLLLVTVVSIVFVTMIKDFLVTLLFAALFASLARPLYLRFLGWTNGRKNTSSALALLVFVLLIVLPIFSFVGLVASQAVKVTQDVAPWVQDKLGSKEDVNSNIRRLPGYKYLRPYNAQIANRVGTMISGLGNLILKGATSLTAGTVLFFVEFAIMLYAMFFFFIDGPAILDKMLYYMPLDSKDERKLLKGFQSMARATIKGIVIIGAAQGTLAGVGFWAAGIPSALFWGTVMAILSVIPNVGAAIVWLPGCIYLFIQGQTTPALLLFAWCAGVVGTADNFLRPMLIGKDTQVHELLILLSTLGGVTLFGLPGFILGPVLALAFLMVWEIYGQTFKDLLPKVGNL